MRRVFALLLALLVATPLPAEAQRKRRTGKLDVKVSVDGAEIAVDGAVVARSPMESPIVLTAGQHSVKVSKPGHSEYLDVVKILPGETRTLEVDLFPFAAAVSVVSDPPGAVVYVDGQLRGRTPYEGEAEPGERTFRLTLDGYETAESTATLIAGKSYDIEVTLVRTEVLTPPTPKEKKLYERWEFWAITGGAVALTTVGILVLTSKDGPSPDRVITPMWP